MAGEGQLGSRREIRIAYRSPAASDTNVDSEKLISFAMACINSPDMPVESGTTQSWFPASGRSVNTSTRMKVTFMASS